jgi:ADP-heptose:LPS heptosyltransferase
MPTVQRICVFAQLHLPGLGDLVQRNIMLALLRRAHPDATVTVVVGETLADRFADLFDGHLYATDLVACPDPGDDDERRWAAFLAELTGRRYQLCLVDPGSHTLGATHARAAGVPVRMGYPQGVSSGRDLTHPIRLPPPLLGFPDLYEYACALAARLGIGQPPRPSETLPELPRRPVEVPELAAPGPRIAVHPTGQPHWNRRWPLERYVQLCDWLIGALGASLYLLGAGDERAELTLLRDRIRQRRPAGFVHVDIDGSIDRTAALIAGVDLFVGNDSGLAHIAAAVRAPTVVIYGPTGTELLWSRIYPRHRGVSLRYSCQAIINTVEDVAGRRCEHGCAVPYEGPDGPYPKCLTDLSVDQVRNAVTAQLRAAEPLGSGGTHAW